MRVPPASRHGEPGSRDDKQPQGGVHPLTDGGLQSSLAAVLEKAMEPVMERARNNGCAIQKLVHALGNMTGRLERRLQEERQYADQRFQRYEELLGQQADSLLRQSGQHVQAVQQLQRQLAQTQEEQKQQRLQQPPPEQPPPQQPQQAQQPQQPTQEQPQQEPQQPQQPPFNIALALAGAVAPMEVVLGRIEAKLVPVARIEAKLAPLEAILAQASLAPVEAALARAEAALSSAPPGSLQSGDAAGPAVRARAAGPCTEPGADGFAREAPESPGGRPPSQAPAAALDWRGAPATRRGPGHAVRNPAATG